MMQKKGSKLEACPERSRKARSSKGRIFVLSGPSGSGKTTLAEKLLQAPQLKRKISRPVSFTTRPKRSGERNKKHYLFITQAGFRRKLKEKKILEWTRYLGHYYATSKDFVERSLRKQRHTVLCLDLKGAVTLKRLYPKNTVTVFIMPPSLEALRKRIGQRCSKTGEEEIKQRLKLAGRELAAAHRFDYCLVNRNLSRAFEELKSIILRETLAR